jgi:tetratricopeptide (TPR) repeat protein
MRSILLTMAIVLVLVGVSVNASAQETNKQDSKSQTAATQLPELAEADQLESLASISFSKRDFKQTENLLQRSLALKEKVLGADHPEVATTLHNLANVYQKAGKYDEAEPLYLRAISIRESKLGASHPDTIQAVKDFACSTHKRDSDKKPDPNKARLMKRADCLFAGLGDDCQLDGVLNGKAARLVAPQYPQGSQATQQINVYVHINEEGKIVSANASPCGDPLLARAAVEAAWQAKFKPRLVNGNSVQVNGVLIYNFVHQ